MGIKARENSQGQIELVDEETGEIVGIQKKRELDKRGHSTRSDSRKGKLRQWVKVRNADGEVCMVPAGTDPATLPFTKKTFFYSEITVDLIIQEVLKGKSLLQVSKIEGMPSYDVLFKWRMKYPEFDSAYQQAKKFRAEYRHDQVLEIAEVTTKDSNVEDRLKTEIYKWSASVDDPDTYGARVKHSGDAKNPVAWVIQTGVPQPDEPEKLEEPKDIPAEFSPVEDEDEDEAAGH